MLSHKAYIFHDNALVHLTIVAKETIKKYEFKGLEPYSYSPDFPPNDYIFSKLKLTRKEKINEDDNLKSSYEIFSGQTFKLYFREHSSSLKM